jgi:hypothetical protein
MGYIQKGDDSEGSMYNIFVVASYHTIMHRVLSRGAHSQWETQQQPQSTVKALLAVGCWLLAVGCWLLAAANSQD